MSDPVVAGALVLAFAVFVTSHLATVVGLIARSPRWRGLVALVAAPLAPYWAFRAGMPVRGGLWLGSAAVYVAARLLAR